MALADTVIAGRYRLLRRLGAGAMGAVYEAIDLETDRRRAVKRMHAHILDRADLRERFRLEARVAGRVASPFVVDVLDVGVDDEGTPFLVMELLRGASLADRLARDRRPLATREVVGYLVQTALALAAIHRAGIVHRDLKPANLFLEERDHEPPRVKVLDFGVAKVLDEAAGEGTSSVGTPVYMAPEQLTGGAVTAAADVYALGLTAFTLLVGHAYWAEEWKRAGGAVPFALAARRGPIEPASARAAHRGITLAPGFDAWFARATAATPEARFESATAAIAALGAALEVPVGEALLREATIAASDEGPRGEDAEGPARAGEITAELDDGGATSGGDTAAAIGATHTATGASTRTATRSDARPATLSAPAALPVPRLSRVAPAILLGALAAAGLAWTHGRASAPPPPAPPLAAPGSTLACPVFAAPEGAGWLGAAAAGTFCERARTALGGSPARTLIPAELLDLPRQPVDGFPADPYGAPDARARSMKAAQARATLWVDGQVDPIAGGFRVRAVIRRPGGAEVDRGEGESPALYAAAREAMAPLAARVFPATALDPAVAAFTRAPDLRAAAALADLSLAMVHNAGTLDDECAVVEARSAELAEMGPGERFRCAYTLGRPAPAGPPPARPSAGSAGALAAWARVDHMIRREDDPAVAAELMRRFEIEPSSWGRATLATTASCLLQSSDAARAVELARVAVLAEPKNPSGEFCAPWVQLATISRGRSGADAVLAAMQAWAPWDSYAWLLAALSPGDDARALAYARRAHALSPLDTYVADVLADALIGRGAREEARAVALGLARGKHPVHRVESDLLLVRIEASEARFGAALARATRAFAPSPDDAGWVRVQRLEIAWRALEIAAVLGRDRAVADAVVERFLDPDPPPLDGAHLDVPLRLPAFCARASLEPSKRCFARLRALRGRLSGGILPDTEAFTDGAERWARGDIPGAVRAFRPLLRTPGPFVAVLAEPMLDAFERAGEPELAARIEAAVPPRDAEFDGASPARVHGARRALARGDRARARALAQQVIDAWSVADETVPAVEEMRALLRKLR